MGNVVTQTAEEIEPNGFQQKADDERCYQTAISDFPNYRTFRNFGKQSIKVLFSDFQNNFFEFSKNLNICERTLSNVYVYKIAGRYLEKLPTYGILKIENDIFYPFSWDFRIFTIFKILSFYGRLKSVLGLFFAFLTKN